MKKGMYRLLESATTSAMRHREPLLMELAIIVHSVLESIVLGVSVRLHPHAKFQGGCPEFCCFGICMQKMETMCYSMLESTVL